MRSRRRHLPAADPAVRRRRPHLAAAACGLLGLAATAAAAQQKGGTEIAAFRVTGVGGEVTVRYELDEWNQDSPVADSFTRTPMWQEELRLQARGYF